MTWLLLNIWQMALDVLPTFLRKERYEALVSSCVLPIQTLHTTTLYQMQHDSRVIYLEKVLNEMYVATYTASNHLGTRLIYITDSEQVSKTYIYQTAENQPLYLETEYLDRPSQTNVQFIVNVPSSVDYDEPRMRALLDYYKMAGKSYLIQII